MECEIKDWFVLHVFCKLHQICSTALIDAVLNYQGLPFRQRDRRILSRHGCEALLSCLAFAVSSVVVHHQHLCTFPGAQPPGTHVAAHGSRVPSAAALLPFCTQDPSSARQPRHSRICHIYKYKTALRVCVGQGRGR